MGIIRIDEKLLAASGGKLALGVVIARGVRVTPINEALWATLQGQGDKLAQSALETIDMTPIDALNVTYKNLGLKLADYKGSNEAFFKRIMSGKGVYQISNIVDANNLVSVASLRSVGSYDLSKVAGDIVFRPGLKDEVYPATKKRPLKLQNLPVLCDDAGPFGSPTSDSERALIIETTTDLMTVIFSFDGLKGLEEQMEMMAQLLIEHASANPEQIKHLVVRDKPIQLSGTIAKGASTAASASVVDLSHFKPAVSNPDKFVASQHDVHLPL